MPLSNATPLAISGFFTIASGLIVVIFAYSQAVRKNYKKHKFYMKIAVTLNAAFLIQYITRVIVFHEITEFEGPNFVRTFIYLPILVIHITGAILNIGLIVVHVVQAYRNEKSQQSGIPYFKSDYRHRHRSFGKKVFYAWTFTFSGGIIIFFLLYVLY